MLPAYRSIICFFIVKARGQKKRIGWFPANYVKMLGSSSARSTPSGETNTQADPSTCPAQQLSVVRNRIFVI